MQLPAFSWAANFTATVVRVADGDTLEVKRANGEQLKLRLYGIDCPELKQAYGKDAQKFTAGKVLQVKVQVQSLETDQYGRIVAIVRYGDKCLNEELVKSGYAWFYKRYCKNGAFCGNLQALELQARASLAGLWRDKNAVPPWEFRRGAANGGGHDDNWDAGLKRLLRGILRELWKFADSWLAD